MAECLKMVVVRHGGVARKVPCGRCAFCLENKRSSWMFRVYYEMRTQEYPGYFLTLTYDEKHVRRTAGGRLSLRFKDVQLFFKSLRREKFYVKYICVGEYGSETSRPHYHMLLWTDCPPEKFERMWFRGRVHVGYASMASAMYVMKYIIQPRVKESKEVPYEHRREDTRLQVSKGLGLGYLSTAMYYYHTADYDRPVLRGMCDGKIVALPRYYRTKIFTKYQLARESHRLKWESIRARRREIRKAVHAGIEGAHQYLQRLRVEQAKRILERSLKLEKNKL